MTERQILFSAPMVRAILAGTKTQTRRALRWLPPVNTVQISAFHHPDPRPMFFAWTRDGAPVDDHPTAGAEISDWPPLPCPYGQPGDRLWVRETFAYHTHALSAASSEDGPWVYAADGLFAGRSRLDDRWRPSIHMPRAASRITLEVTGVRVERLQAISRGDAMAEGCPFANMAAGPDPRDWYRDLWDQINGDGAWAANPWVWVVEFKRVEA